MEIKCLFENRGSFCSENTFSLTKRSDCRSNIGDQLKKWHLSQHFAFVQEHELILYRSGLPHDLASEQLERLWLCEKPPSSPPRKTISVQPKFVFILTLVKWFSVTRVSAKIIFHAKLSGGFYIHSLLSLRAIYLGRNVLQIDHNTNQN